MHERGFKTIRDTSRLNSLLPRRRSGPIAGQAGHGQGLVEELVTSEMPRLLALARRYSLCSDDAYDACQRGIEILIRRIDSLQPETADAWLRNVVKHEAMAVRAERIKGVAATADSLDGLMDVARVDQSVDLIERLRVATEALGRLKVHEAEALRLRAEGLTYNEIADLRGWSYTKVNRLVTEGRRAFRQRVSAIDSGAQCREILDALSEGNGRSSLGRQIIETHLARCQACRLEARVYVRGGAPLSLAVPLLAAVMARLTTSVHAAGSWSGERALSLGTRAQVWLEAVSTGKAAAVAASAVALAGGGAAIRTEATHRHMPLVSAHQAQFEAGPAADPTPTTRVDAQAAPTVDPGGSATDSTDPGARAAAEFDPIYSEATVGASNAKPAPVARPVTSPAAQKAAVNRTVEFGP